MKSQSCEPKFPTRVEWDSDGSVDVFVDDDEEALLMTAQEGCCGNEPCRHHGLQQRRSEELFSCLQKLVVASMSIGLIGLGVAFIFLIEYIAGW